MSYELFRAAIKEPALLEVGAHWHAVRGDRLMPAWQDIDAVTLGRNLPIVWGWRYDLSLDTFVGRLAGEEIIAVLGVNIRGRRLETCFPSDAVAVVRQRYRAVMEGPRFMRSHGKIFGRDGSDGHGERIVLPIAADGAKPDGIIGATVYRLGSPATRGSAAIDHHNEVVSYYPLTA